MTFLFKKLEIPEIILVEPQLFSDTRGFFFESFKESDFSLNGIHEKFVQDNYSHSSHGVIRGLHYQKSPKHQAKLITVVQGEIFDVAVDSRTGSPTFGQWVGEILSDNNHRSLYIPKGFAHGFCVISEEADIFYKVSSEYSKEHEQGIMWNDPNINILWPHKKPIISDKDNKLTSLENSDNNFCY